MSNNLNHRYFFYRFSDDAVSTPELEPLLQPQQRSQQGSQQITASPKLMKIASPHPKWAQYSVHDAWLKSVGRKPKVNFPGIEMKQFEPNVFRKSPFRRHGPDEYGLNLNDEEYSYQSRSGHML